MTNYSVKRTLGIFSPSSLFFLELIIIMYFKLITSNKYNRFFGCSLQNDHNSSRTILQFSKEMTGNTEDSSFFFRSTISFYLFNSHFKFVQIKLRRYKTPPSLSPSPLRSLLRLHLSQSQKAHFPMDSISPVIGRRLTLPAATASAAPHHYDHRPLLSGTVFRSSTRVSRKFPAIRVKAENKVETSSSSSSSSSSAAAAEAANRSIDFNDPNWKSKYQKDFEARFRIPHLTDVFPDAVSYPSTFCLKMRSALLIF